MPVCPAPILSFTLIMCLPLFFHFFSFSLYIYLLFSLFRTLCEVGSFLVTLALCISLFTSHSFTLCLYVFFLFLTLCWTFLSIADSVAFCASFLSLSVSLSLTVFFSHWLRVFLLSLIITLSLNFLSLSLTPRFLLNLNMSEWWRAYLNGSVCFNLRLKWSSLLLHIFFYFQPDCSAPRNQRNVRIHTFSSYIKQLSRMSFLPAIWSK